MDFGSLSARNEEAVRQMDEQLELLKELEPHGTSFKSSFKAKHLSMWKDVSTELRTQRSSDFEWAELRCEIKA